MRDDFAEDLIGQSFALNSAVKRLQNAPKKPTNAFLMFCQKNRDLVQVGRDFTASIMSIIINRVL